MNGRGGRTLLISIGSSLTGGFLAGITTSFFLESFWAVIAGIWGYNLQMVAYVRFNLWRFR